MDLRGSIPTFIHISEVDPPKQQGTDAQIDNEARLFARYCASCHGDSAVGGGINPDLRYSGALNYAASWQAIVYDGVLATRGMVNFNNAISKDGVESIRHYIVS